VHLAVQAEQAAAGIDDDGCIVVNTRRALFEKRGDEDDLVSPGQLLQGLAARPGIGSASLK